MASKTRPLQTGPRGKRRRIYQYNNLPRLFTGLLPCHHNQLMTFFSLSLFLNPSQNLMLTTVRAARINKEFWKKGAELRNRCSMLSFFYLPLLESEQQVFDQET